jgi:hypothetical protein
MQKPHETKAGQELRFTSRDDFAANFKKESWLSAYQIAEIQRNRAATKVAGKAKLVCGTSPNPASNGRLQNVLEQTKAMQKPSPISDTPDACLQRLKQAMIVNNELTLQCQRRFSPPSLSLSLSLSPSSVSRPHETPPETRAPIELVLQLLATLQDFHDHRARLFRKLEA